MTIVFYLVLALAFSIADMLLLHRCTQSASIRLTRGLGVALLIASVQTSLFLLGQWTGNLLRFELPDNPNAFTTANTLVFIGLDLFVVLRMLSPYLRKKAVLPEFNLDSNQAVAALGFASGINLLLLGLGCGFIRLVYIDFHAALWPLLILTMLASYWGIMLGRRSITLRPKRWMLFASLLLAGLAVAALLQLR
ncbi:MAG: hypothetical protein IJU19_06590 [Bacteroidales bacterium]|nr:hypothetical protein [Bacteroidales bacterium]